ncbi:MAG: desulfoferrodoxin [Planctomycetota bacterium]
MAERLEVYACEGCGNIVEVLTGGPGGLECCGCPMKRLEAKTADEGKEKHVPVVEASDGGLKVTVGGVPHPMLEKHYIEWIELVHGGKAYREFLEPGAEPAAAFAVDAAPEDVTAREHCNVHGLWAT